MKKWLLPVMLMSGLTLTTSACSPPTSRYNRKRRLLNPEPEPDPSPDNPTPEPGTDGRALVVYFCTNTTKVWRNTSPPLRKAACTG